MRDYSVQLVFSVAAYALAITLITQALTAAAATPAVTAVVEPFPTAERVAELYGLQFSDGSVQGLACACTVQSTPLAAVSNWSYTSDSFCDAIDAAVREPEAFVDELRESRDFERCIFGQGTEAWGSFLGHMRAYALGTELFAGVPDFEASLTLFAGAMETALCGLAFGGSFWGAALAAALCRSPSARGEATSHPGGIPLLSPQNLHSILTPWRCRAFSTCVLTPPTQRRYSCYRETLSTPASRGARPSLSCSRRDSGA